MIPNFPALFMRTATSLITHGQPILRPPISDKLEFAIELAVAGA